MIKSNDGKVEANGTGTEIRANLSTLLIELHRWDPAIVEDSLKMYEALKGKTDEEIKEYFSSAHPDEIFGDKNQSEGERQMRTKEEICNEIAKVKIAKRNAERENINGASIVLKNLRLN